MPFGGVLQSRVARRHLDAVQQNHDADVDPDQEHYDCDDRAVDDVPGRKVGGIPGKQRKGDAHTSMSMPPAPKLTGIGRHLAEDGE